MELEAAAWVQDRAGRVMGSPQATVAHQEAPCMQIMGPSSELHGAQSLGDTA